MFHLVSRVLGRFRYLIPKILQTNVKDLCSEELFFILSPLFLFEVFEDSVLIVT